MVSAPDAYGMAAGMRPPSSWPSVLEWVLTGIAVVALLSLTFCVAKAEPPPGADPNSPMAKWFRSLDRPDGLGGCCSSADCREVEARIVDGHWRVEIKGVEWDIPDKVIIHQKDNPTGHAVACWIDIGDGPHFLCFVAGSET